MIGIRGINPTDTHTNIEPIFSRQIANSFDARTTAKPTHNNIDITFYRWWGENNNQLYPPRVNTTRYRVSTKERLVKILYKSNSEKPFYRSCACCRTAIKYILYIYRPRVPSSPISTLNLVVCRYIIYIYILYTVQVLRRLHIRDLECFYKNISGKAVLVYICSTTVRGRTRVFFFFYLNDVFSCDEKPQKDSIQFSLCISIECRT